MTTQLTAEQQRELAEGFENLFNAYRRSTLRTVAALDRLITQLNYQHRVVTFGAALMSPRVVVKRQAPAPAVPPPAAIEVMRRGGIEGPSTNSPAGKLLSQNMTTAERRARLARMMNKGTT